MGQSPALWVLSAPDHQGRRSQGRDGLPVPEDPGGALLVHNSESRSRTPDLRGYGPEKESITKSPRSVVPHSAMNFLRHNNFKVTYSAFQVHYIFGICLDTHFLSHCIWGKRSQLIFILSFAYRLRSWSTIRRRRWCGGSSPRRSNTASPAGWKPGRPAGRDGLNSQPT